MSFIEAIKDLDADTRASVAALRRTIEDANLTPAQVATRLAEGARDPKKFDAYIERFLKDRMTYSRERAIAEFHILWSSLIVDQGCTAKEEGIFIIIYDKDGKLDTTRTAALAKIPDMLTLYQTQMTYLRSFHDTVSKSAKERAMNMVTEYNKSIK